MVPLVENHLLGFVVCWANVGDRFPWYREKQYPAVVVAVSSVFLFKDGVYLGVVPVCRDLQVFPGVFYDSVGYIGRPTTSFLNSFWMLSVWTRIIAVAEHRDNIRTWKTECPIELKVSFVWNVAGNNLLTNVPNSGIACINHKFEYESSWEEDSIRETFSFSVTVRLSLLISVVFFLAFSKGTPEVHSFSHTWVFPLQPCWYALVLAGSFMEVTLNEYRLFGTSSRLRGLSVFYFALPSTTSRLSLFQSIATL